MFTRNMLSSRSEYSRILSFEEAVFGIAGEKSLGSLNMQSSPGLPWIHDKVIGHSKKELFKFENGVWTITEKGKEVKQ